MELPGYWEKSNWIRVNQKQSGISRKAGGKGEVVIKKKSCGISTGVLVLDLKIS